MDIAQRFWSKVNKRGPIHPKHGQCWVWTDTPMKNGYGRLRIGSRTDKSRRVLASHRLSWELHNGPITKGLFVCHKCDNPICVNPNHLFLGTSRGNMRDRVAKGRANIPKGSAHTISKLTEQDVLEIRASKVSILKLAKRYGVSYQQISRIRLRQNWQHLESPGGQHGSRT